MFGFFKKKFCPECNKVKILEKYDCCEDCEIRLRIEKENIIKCPSCLKVDMTKNVIDDIIIDKCPECEGVFLDKGELSKLTPEQYDNFAAGLCVGIAIG